MSQAPAISKTTRSLQTLAMTLFGKPLAFEAKTEAETAAMALRAKSRGETWQKPTTVTFLIPLVGPEMVSDWAVVETLLTNTLASFQAQTDPRWHAVISCQVKPNLPDDPRITYVTYDQTGVGNDKWAKLSTLYTHLADTVSDAGLSMTFDADDIAHPELVAALLSKPNGSLITHGIVFDVQRDRLAQARPQSLVQPGAKAFWKLCGSCAALPYDPSQASFDLQMAFVAQLSQYEHRMVPYFAALAGYSLGKQTQSHVLYLLNHGENFGARRGRVSFKTRFVDRFEITDQKRLKNIRSQFNLTP